MVGGGGSKPDGGGMVGVTGRGRDGWAACDGAGGASFPFLTIPLLLPHPSCLPPPRSHFLRVLHEGATHLSTHTIGTISHQVRFDHAPARPPLQIRCLRNSLLPLTKCSIEVAPSTRKAPCTIKDTAQPQNTRSLGRRNQGPPQSVHLSLAALPPSHSCPRFPLLPFPSSSSPAFPIIRHVSW